MITRKTKRKTGREASKYLEALMGGPLTLGAALSGLREADEQKLAQFAKLLGVSRSHLCDIAEPAEPGSENHFQGRRLFCSWHFREMVL